jgi:adenosylcobinamide-phosphate synthase
MEAEFLIVIFLAVFVDLTLGEFPLSFHPVVLMGIFIEKIGRGFLTNSKIKNRFLGFLLTIFMAALFSSFFYIILYFSSFNNVF